MIDKKRDISDLYIEITNKCNCKCTYCYNESGIDKTCYLTKERHQEIICSAKKLNVKRINISGGEPFLHPDLAEFLRINDENEMDTVLITNGTLLDDYPLDSILKYEPLIRISFDSISKNIFCERRGVDLYDKTLQGIEKLIKDYNYRKVSIRINVDYDNYAFIDKEILAWKELGIEEVYLSLIVASGRGKKENHLNHADDWEKVEYIRRKAIQHSEDSFVAKFEGGVGVSCPYVREANGYITLAINAVGEVYPCLLLCDPTFSLGNIYVKSLSDIVINGKFDKFCELINLRKEFMKECEKCNMSQICDRGCLANVIVNGHGFFETDGRCAERRKSILQAIKIGKRDEVKY